MARTTADLLTSVKRRAQLPDDSGTLSDSDILAFADDEIQNSVYPRLQAVNEWHYAFTYSETLSSQRSYRLHPRCSGNRIYSVEYYDGANYRFIPMKHPLTQRALDGENYAIYGNTIVLSDSVPSTGSLRIRASLRPSKLVTSGCAATNLWSNGTSVIYLSSTTGWTAGQLVDVVYASSPYELYVITDITAVDAPGNNVTVSATNSTGKNFVAADTPTATAGRLCPAEQTDRVQLPDELHDYLAQRVAIRCMEARGFTQDMNNHLRKLADLEQAFDRLVSPRSKGEFKAIVPESYDLVGWI